MVRSAQGDAERSCGRRDANAPRVRAAGAARSGERAAGDGPAACPRRRVPAQMNRNGHAMNRRNFLKLAGSLPLASIAPDVAWATAPAHADYRNLLVLIELKGGNDGLNTVVPYANPAYYALRPKL